MEKVKAVFAAIDAAIQRKFDAFVFFLMRAFGWRKSLIRYALWAITITSMIGDQLLALANTHVPVPVTVVVIVLMALLVFCYLKIQAREYQHDREAERRGALSRSDIWAPAVLVLMKGYFYVVLTRSLGQVTAILAITDFFRGGYAKLARELPMIGFELSFLAILYLVRTPPEPPPREEKLKVLVPVREHSS